MDDDLRTLLAKPDPSPEMVDRGRHQLQNAMRGPSSHRVRRVWLASGLGLTAAAAGVAIVVTSGTTAAPPTPKRPPAAAKALTGRQVLLAAADTALTSPQPTGTYWHVKTEYTKWSGGHPSTAETPIETWIARDGRSWVRAWPSTTIVVNGGRDGMLYADGFNVGSTQLSYAQVQAMPTDQAALAKWLRQRAPRQQPFEGVLLGLLADTPAPPKSRAAAFRILASRPGVKSLGRVKGGVGLMLPDPDGQDELILDPATSQVRSLTFSGSRDGQKTGGGEVVTAGWTDRLG